MKTFSLKTFLTKTCRLNFTSLCIYFSSLGLSVLMHALMGFHARFISKSICGLLPLARLRNFRSFKAYHRFSPSRILSNGMTTLPKNSTLWSRSSSKTVMSSTLLMSLTLKVNIFCQEGDSVLYSVCVCNRALPSSRTQKGSLLPPKSAAAKPVALYTLTVRCPTSLIL